MASSLPTIPRVVFTIIEPISLVAGFLGAIVDPAWFVAEQVPQTKPIIITENSIVLALELGNLYLLLAFIGLAVLNTTSEVKVVRSYLVALWLGDIGHILFSGYGLGEDKLFSPAEWNAMAWGNVAMTHLSRDQADFAIVTHSGIPVHIFLRVSMDTRNRRKRADPPASAPDPPKTRAGTRSTRQTATPSATLPDPAHEQNGTGRLSAPASEGSKPKGLLSNPIPRRGARVAGRAPSVASIVTLPPRAADEETELGDGDHIAEALSQDLVAHGVDDEAQATRYKIMEQVLPDLIKTSEELMGRLERANYEDPVFHGLIAVKKSAFHGARQFFEEEHTSPLIDLAQAAIIKNGGDSVTSASAIVRANIVTVLDEVHILKAGQKEDPSDLLEMLDIWFPSLFIVPKTLFQDPQLTLDIRTWHLIEVLNSQEGKLDFKKTIADVFCKPEDDGLSYTIRFASGPFKSLGEADHDDIEEIVSDRIAKIIPIVKKDKKTYGVGKLREMFPLEQLLDDLGAWLAETYGMLKSPDLQDGPKRGPEPEQFVDAEEEIGDSQTDIASESQPIVRAGEEAEIEPTLFDRGKPFIYFDAQNRANSMAPPSGQQQAVPRPGAPRDYREHTNADLLGSPLPPSSALVLERKQANAQASASKRPRVDDPFGSDDEDDEEEDPFETDSRPVDKGKRAAISAMMPPPKRPRAAPAPTAPSLSPSSQFPQSSQAESEDLKRARVEPTPIAPMTSQSSQFPQPTQDDFENLRRAKIEVSQRARMQTTTFAKQRHVWSHHDTALLIQLIRDRHAAWSAIERYDNDKFEHPRNQQAYRDKARNMKVDYLMTDAIMPPRFDLVALGKKETDRLMSLGKNPARKEADVDLHGRATNTEYLGPPPGSQ
ncbi:hypothetical protein B0J13DRAFT_671811 [Dactylonectria estremocensis]|uniref:DUF7704 domain-containing protein n=1 Tax=Dactylonectria estremocensis TaxID=1079267 RepID=A0A9P9FCD7_9HYPO|nr:hypothetical protein B0J13DRAFT_671811 [Dactylonectria estremocensis]